MKVLPKPNNKAMRRKAALLVAIILLQALCAVFFFGDVLADLHDGDHLDDIHMALEALAAFVLVVGVIYLMLELRDLLWRVNAMETGLQAARGEMAAVMDRFFDEWRLTASEREVAMLMLKGCDNEEISRLRGTAVSTVRAQTASIYGKAGVSGRGELFSLFMDELLAGDPLLAKAGN
jgi:DNA-binding CsgD family transcriptional regulator